MINSIEKTMDEDLICGVDEVGRGPLAGPVVACAVIMPKEEIEGVNDSKKLSKKKRLTLYEKIKNHALAVGYGIKGPEVIDKVNIKQATILAMEEAVENLVNSYSVKPEIVLVDAETLNLEYRSISYIKGDSLSYNIACASILAKVFRDSMFEKYDKEYPGYGFLTNVGYGTKAHREALASFGLTPIHRRSFLGNLEVEDGK